MVKMASQQQPYISRYPNLLVTVKNETEERSVGGRGETYSNSRTTRRSKDNSRSQSFHGKNVFYNSNHRQQQQQQQQSYYTRPSHISPRRQQQSYYPVHDRFHYQYQNQPIRPLMEIKDNRFSLHNDFDDNDDDDNNDDENINYSISKAKEPKQRGQYRNRKAELDWDHAFDLDLIDLYTTHPDSDSCSLTSTISSSVHSFSSM